MSRLRDYLASARRTGGLAVLLAGAAACRGDVPGVAPPAPPELPPAAGAPPARPDGDPPAPLDGPDGDTRPSPATPLADGGSPLTSVAQVFDPAVLHRIAITVDPAHLGQLDLDQLNRVPCTIVYDGTTLAGSGIRKKGGRGSLRPLADKPSFSVKFNELVKGQKLAGLGKLLLHNAIQDRSFLNEHIVYEIARREGLAAPLTAHGLVTFNGQPYGLYVVREAINQDFLRRTFGKGNETGNLYEGGGLGKDFLRAPDQVELKDEVEEMRSRDDLREVARLSRTTPDARWAEVMAGKLDLPNLIRAAALEWLVGQWDGYFFNANNYYVYHHPTTDRFAYVVVGMDWVLDHPLLEWGGVGMLLEKIQQLPDLKARYQTSIAEIVGNLNVEEIHARIDQVARTIHTHTPADRRTRDNFSSFDRNLAQKKAAILSIKTNGMLPLRPDAGSADR